LIDLRDAIWLDLLEKESGPNTTNRFAGHVTKVTFRVFANYKVSTKLLLRMHDGMLKLFWVYKCTQSISFNDVLEVFCADCA